MTFLRVLALLVLVTVSWGQYTSFIGSGYDILTANPDGSEERIGALDPGIKRKRKIFELTYNEGRKSASGQPVPDEVIYEETDSCATHKTDSLFFGGKSYQKKLNVSVNLGGSYGVPALLAFSFSASGRYKKETREVSHKKTVYHEEVETCNYGTARYRLELAKAKGYKLAEGFYHAGCELKTAKSGDDHLDFIKTWGTHVILEAFLGTKKMKRMENEMSQLFEFAMSDVGAAVNIGGTYQGIGGTLKVDVEKFSEEANLNQWKTGTLHEYRKGTKARPEPLEVTLDSIDSVFIPDFWDDPSIPCRRSAGDLGKIQQHLRTAMTYYPRWLGLALPKGPYPVAASYGNKVSHYIPTDPVLQYKLTWPKGTYALPETDKGCPEARWLKGMRKQQTGENNRFEPASPHWPRGTLRDGEITQSFCTKSNEEGEFSWQKGQYCIFKVKKCPEGFEEGSILWDDYGSADENMLKYGGSMPDGEYGKNTKIEFCCRNDGLAGNPIYLPPEKPFYLLAKVLQCQKVNSMHVKQEIIRWDDQNLGNISAKDGSHPLDTSPSGTNHKLHYCYYMPN